MLHSGSFVIADYNESKDNTNTWYQGCKKKKKKGEREKGKIRIKLFAIFIDDAAFQPPAPTVKIIVLILCNEKIQLDYH